MTTKKGRAASPHFAELIAALEALEAQTDFTEVLRVRTSKPRSLCVTFLPSKQPLLCLECVLRIRRLTRCERSTRRTQVPAHVRSRVRRSVPPPALLQARFQAVLQPLRGLRCRKSGRPLITEVTEKVITNQGRHIAAGCVSDPRPVEVRERPTYDCVAPALRRQCALCKKRVLHHD